MWRTDSLEKTLMLERLKAGGERDNREWDAWMASPTQNSMDMSLSKTPGVGDGQGGPACCSPWGHKESNTNEWLNWTESGFWYSENQRFLFLLWHFQRLSMGYLVWITYLTAIRNWNSQFSNVKQADVYMLNHGFKWSNHNNRVRD